jgi:hypothetical protein
MREMAAPMPNCLIIGAAKSGTTSLWHQLQHHPQIFMHAGKQLNFFSSEGGANGFRGPPPRDVAARTITTVEAYRLEFSDALGNKVIGEASNSYLYDPRAAVGIKHHIPDAKLIAILRHPAERAYSRYLQLVRSGREVISDFMLALREEDSRIDEGWWPDFHYLHMGLYYQQLIRYFSLFEREQIRIYLFEDFQRDPLAVAQDAFRFLGVDPTFVPDTRIAYSASGIPRNRVLHLLLQEARALRPLAERYLSGRALHSVLVAAGKLHNRNLVKPPLSPDARQWLIERYRDDTLSLQALLGRDLSSWLR